MRFVSTDSNPLKGLDDITSWKLLRDGDHRGLEYIYRAHGKVLFNFGMKLYGKHDWVEDTLQELFVDLWRDRQRLASVTSLRTYLLKAFKYKLIRQYGKEKRWSYVDHERLPEVEVTLSDESRMISEQLTVDKQIRLAKTLEKLPIRQREVLHLLFQEAMSYEDISIIMGINVRSVYTLAWKSIKGLRKLVGGSPYLLIFPLNYLL